MQDYGIYLLVCILDYVNGLRLLVKSVDHLLADSLSAMQNLSQLIDEIDNVNKKLELHKQQKSRHDDDKSTNPRLKSKACKSQEAFASLLALIRYGDLQVQGSLITRFIL